MTLQPFRFDASTHRYFTVATTGDLDKVWNITSMLEAAGWVDKRWYTEEGRERGTTVHDLTASYDLGGLDVPSLKTVDLRIKPYVLQHVRAAQVVRPEWEHVEVPFVHPTLRFGGRPDRVGRVYAARAVADIKTGEAAKWHAIQTALQAILVAPFIGLPPEAIQRYGWYLTPKKFHVELFPNRQDFDEARRIIRKCCGTI